MNWIVAHRNTPSGRWANDGEEENWTEEEANAHAARCEYAEKGIEFVVQQNKTKTGKTGRVSKNKRLAET